MTNKLNFKESILAAAYAAILSAVVNGLLFFILHATGVFTDDIFVQPDTPLTMSVIVMGSIFPTIIAGIFFSYLRSIRKMG